MEKKMAAASPFPGMDPYLEARWSDVHAKLIGFIGEALQPLLPPSLRARSEERVLVETLDEGSWKYRSDLALIETSTIRRGPLAESGSPAAQSGTLTTEVNPILIRRQMAPIIDRWVQVIDVTNGNRVITAIEILSPWNKASGRLNRDYLRKVEHYASGGVTLVEIDLLRFPSRERLAVTEIEIPLDRRAAYMVCVRAGWDPETWRAYPMPLRAPLPSIPIPLRQADAPVMLALQPLIERVYAAGGHDDIDYSIPPDPPLTDDDARWAVQLLGAIVSPGAQKPRG
jgi:hypothetical protein